MIWTQDQLLNNTTVTMATVEGLIVLWLLEKKSTNYSWNIWKGLNRTEAGLIWWIIFFIEFEQSKYIFLAIKSSRALWSKSKYEKFSRVLRIKPGTTRRKALTPPLCSAIPLASKSWSIGTVQAAPSFKCRAVCRLAQTSNSCWVMSQGRGLYVFVFAEV